LAGGTLGRLLALVHFLSPPPGVGPGAGFGRGSPVGFGVNVRLVSGAGPGAGDGRGCVVGEMTNAFSAPDRLGTCTVFTSSDPPYTGQVMKSPRGANIARAC
jgi:hypothetical protein